MPRIGKKTESIRLNLELNVEIRERLEVLRDETRADSLTEVVRRSLAVYDYLWGQKRTGAKLIVEDSEGKRERELVLLP